MRLSCEESFDHEKINSHLLESYQFWKLGFSGKIQRNFKAFFFRV